MMLPEEAIELLQRASLAVESDPTMPDSGLAAWYARCAEKIADDPRAVEWPYIQRDIARAESYFAPWAPGAYSKEN